MIQLQVFLSILVISLIIMKPIKIEFINHLVNKFDKYNIFFFILITLIILFLRLYNLTSIPKGINIDEAGLIYDTMSISKDGVDRYGISYPIYLNNYGQGMSVLYLYLNMLFSFSKVTLFKTRFIIASLSVLMAIISYFIVRMEYEKKYALLAYFLIATLPYFVMASRWALDCNLMIIFTTFTLFLFLKSIQKDSAIYYLLTGILFGITLYSYALAYLILPIFISISIIYLFIYKKISFKNIFVMLLPIIIFAIPLLLFIAVNNNLLSEFKLFGVFSISKIIEYRSSEISLNNISTNINVFKIYLLGLQWDFSVIRQFTTIYYFSIPLILYGVYKSILKIKKGYSQDSIMLIYLFSAIMVTLVIENPNISKSNFVYFSLIYFLISGLSNLNKKNNLTILIVISYILLSFVFTNYYFRVYANFNLTFFENDIYEVIDYLEENNEKGPIFIDMGNNYMAQIPIMISLNSSYKEHNYSEIENYDLYLNTSINYAYYLFRSDKYEDLKIKLRYDGYKVKDISGFEVYYK